MRIKPHHSLSLLRLRPDVHARMLGLLAEGEVDGATLQSALGEVKVGNPIAYEMNGKRDQFAFAEVIRLGEGEPVGSGMDRPEVEAGDIVGLDLGQAGHEFPDGTVSCLWKNLICRFTPGEDVPDPLSSWVLTKKDEITMRRFVMSNRDPVLHLPNHTRGSISSTKGKPNSGVRLTASPILKVGRGSFVKKAFVEPCVVGETALFGHTCPVHLAWTEGRVLQFVRWSDVDCSIDWSDDAA